MAQFTTKGLDSRGLFLRFMEEVKSAIRVDELAAHQKEYFDRQGAVEAERKGLKLEALGKLASVVKELRDAEKVKDTPAPAPCYQPECSFSFSKRSNLPVKERFMPPEDPLEFVHGLDLSEIEVSDGGYYFDHADNDPYEADPYRGADWLDKLVYGQNSLLGGKAPAFRSVLMREEFMLSLSIGLQRRVGFNPRSVGGNSPTIGQIVSAWYQVLDKKISTNVCYPRDKWTAPLIIWIHSLTSMQARQYLVGVRKEIDFLRTHEHWESNARLLLRAATYAEEQLSLMLSNLDEA